MLGGQRDNEDAEGTAHQADDHPGPPHAQPRRGAVAHLAEERIAEHGQQGADPGDKRQAVRCPSDPHQRVDLQRQGDQQGAMNTREVLMYASVYSEMKPIPPGAARATQAPAQPRLRSGISMRPARRREADAGGRRGRYPRTGNVGHCALLGTAWSQAANGKRKRALPARVLTGYGQRPRPAEPRSPGAWSFTVCRYTATASPSRALRAVRPPECRDAAPTRRSVWLLARSGSTHRHLRRHQRWMPSVVCPEAAHGRSPPLALAMAQPENPGERPDHHINHYMW